MPTRDYRDLRVWQRAMELVVASYHAAGRLPSSELYALANQIRRAAVSIPANIAEGNGRLHCRDYIHHLSIARGSIMELLTHFEIATRLGYFAESELEAPRGLADLVGRMLTRLIMVLHAADPGHRLKMMRTPHPPCPESPVPI